MTSTPILSSVMRDAPPLYIFLHEIPSESKHKKSLVVQPSIFVKMAIPGKPEQTLQTNFRAKSPTSMHITFHPSYTGANCFHLNLHFLINSLMKPGRKSLGKYISYMLHEESQSANEQPPVSSAECRVFSVNATRRDTSL